MGADLANPTDVGYLNALTTRGITPKARPSLPGVTSATQPASRSENQTHFNALETVFAALVVKYLTGRFIGEYQSDKGKCHALRFYLHYIREC